RGGNRDHHIVLAKGGGRHTHEIRVTVRADGEPIAEQAVLGFLRQRGGTATKSEDGDLAGLRDEACRLLYLLRVDLMFRLVDRAARFVENRFPAGQAAVLALERLAG